MSPPQRPLVSLRLQLCLTTNRPRPEDAGAAAGGPPRGPRGPTDVWFRDWFREGADREGADRSRGARPTFGFGFGFGLPAGGLRRADRGRPQPWGPTDVWFRHGDRPTFGFAKGTDRRLVSGCPVGGAEAGRSQ